MAICRHVILILFLFKLVMDQRGTMYRTATMDGPVDEDCDLRHSSSHAGE